MSREDTNNKKGKPHRDRKNPHAAEEFQKQRHEKNSLRPKQKFDIVTSEWKREAV
jgi:hypothetical protein